MSEEERNIWEQIVAAQRERRPVVAATVVRSTGSVPRRTGAKMLIHENGAISGSVGGGLFESLVVTDALEALAAGNSATKTYSFNPKGAGPQAFGAVCGGRADIFLEVIVPNDRLLIVGGGHCGRALARMAGALGFSIVVADDRAEFARPERYPQESVESVLHLPPDYAGLPEADSRTYVALVSKGFVTDAAALRRVLFSEAAYIGMIGSRRKRDVVYSALRVDGITDADLTRVHAPIGIEIGAETPEEIAVSILAEIIAVRAKQRSNGMRQPVVDVELVDEAYAGDHVSPHHAIIPSPHQQLSAARVP